MDFRLLGPLEVADHERLLVLGGVKQRLILAMLLLQANEVVSVDRLLEGLWGDTPPATAAKSIQLSSHGCARSSATAAWRPAHPDTCCSPIRGRSTSPASSAS